ncbi:MAG: hypothetical protein GEV07_09815 [Streptosporangiales bacterium]|nr:hypothetical protein [Streptosporangiales bacterium]
MWDTLTPVEEVMATFDVLVRSGKVRAVGLSDVPAWYATKAQLLADRRGWEPVAALQLEYSLVERNIEREHVPAARDLGIGLVPWGPLASGLLTGKYTRGADGPVGDGRLQAFRESPMLSAVSEQRWECSTYCARWPRRSGGRPRRSLSAGCCGSLASPHRSSAHVHLHSWRRIWGRWTSSSPPSSSTGWNAPAARRRCTPTRCSTHSTSAT